MRSGSSSRPYLPIGECDPYPEWLRQQFEGVIWRFRTGGQWREMPQEFGAWSTVSNRFRQWREPIRGSPPPHRACSGLYEPINQRPSGGPPSPGPRPLFRAATPCKPMLRDQAALPTERAP